MEENHDSNKPEKKSIKMDSWKISTAVLAVLLIISVVTGGFKFSLGSKGSIDNTISFINKELLRGGSEATLDGYEDLGGVYKLNLVIRIQNNQRIFI